MNALTSEINQTQVELGGLQIWWTGQEGFVFKSRGQIIYIDRYQIMDHGGSIGFHREKQDGIER
jgi:L-ascorbate metabolism protein UlaG (beta-lactamase superfamily)